jgi:hypothetical protein
MRGVLALQLELWVFGSPGGLQVPTFGSVGFTLTLSPKWGCDTEHPFLHQGAKPPEFHKLASDCENMAQCPPTEGGHVNLVDSKLGPPGWHLAPTDGNFPHVQNLWLRDHRIPPALPTRLPLRATCLGGIQEDLGRLEGAWRHGFFLAFHSA